MNQYRIIFKHPAQCVGDMVIELSGSVLVAAEDSVSAREKFVRQIQKCLELSITSVGFVDSLDEVPAM